jgi:hypothetical protein
MALRFRIPLRRWSPAPFLSAPLRRMRPLAAASVLLLAFTMPGGPYTFRELDLHPDVLFRPYTAGPLLSDGTALSARTIQAFRELLDQYAQRQAQDDNFTIRVSDNRTGKLLEVYELKAERARFEREGRADWEAVDRLRREATKRLVDKYEQRGMPRSTVSAKWGRANQVLEAREAEEAFIAYEVRLARTLGLSLLATEIGTVETFNQDKRISTVGARGRYQMMPATLRQHSLNRYDLTTAAGTKITAAEEWHPLLTMEPAFVTLRGYTNAVGHELPGLSAYHAGPGNIFRIYRLFMEQQARLRPSSTVVDAYVWAITDGFDTVSEGSSFGSYSRGYVPSTYGSLRATENLPVDTTRTMLAERVQLRPGKEILLSRLLRTLDAHRDRLRLQGSGRSLYQTFRTLNPHIPLPVAVDGVPVRGDVRLVARSAKGNKTVRFFLPLGATEALAEAGLDLLDEDATFRFDHATFAIGPSDKTEADRDYEALVEDIGRFGFTNRNRTRLLMLKTRFEQLARVHPTPYRRMQLRIIRIHEGLWNSQQWETLAGATTTARSRMQEG